MTGELVLQLVEVDDHVDAQLPEPEDDVGGTAPVA